jgi:hypothetical protein
LQSVSPAWVTVMPGTWRRRSRRAADIWSALRVRWSRLTSRMYIVAYILPCALPLLMVVTV